MSALGSFVLAFLLALTIWNFVLGEVLEKHPGYRQDPEMGRVFAAGKLVNGGEGYSRTQINSLGMRNPEVGPKDPAETRVLFLGDSFTSAFQVPDGHSFVDRLRAILGDRYDLVNGGRDAVSPSFYIGLADFYRRKIDPDLVVVEITPRNLLSQMTDRSSNFYAVHAEGGWRVVHNTAFVSNNAIAGRFARFRGLIALPAAKMAAENTTRMFVPVRDLTVETGGKLDPELCRWTVRSLHQRYRKLVILYTGVPAYFGASPPDPIGAILHRECDALWVPLVDVGPIFRDHYARTGEVSHGFSNSLPGTGHLNDVGHRLVAEALAPAIQGVR